VVFVLVAVILVSSSGNEMEASPPFTIGWIHAMSAWFTTEEQEQEAHTLLPHSSSLRCCNQRNTYDKMALVYPFRSDKKPCRHHPCSDVCYLLVSVKHIFASQYQEAAS